MAVKSKETKKTQELIPQLGYLHNCIKETSSECSSAFWVISAPTVISVQFLIE